jgi:DNA-binding LacI/PurR family transcriptional regulator
MVAPDARERVEAVARELRFVPNPMARGLAKQQTGNLGLIVPDIANPYFSPLVKDLQSDARKRGLTLFVADTDEHSSREYELATAMSQQVDGLVLASPRMTDDMIRSLATDVPLVTLGRLIEGVSGVDTPAGDGIRQAIELLAAQGHRNLSYLDGPSESFVAAGRRKAAIAAAEAFGCSLDVLGPFQPVIAAGKRAADLVMASKASAIIAYNDPIAFGCVTRLKESGKRVPEDYCVIGIDNSPITEYSDPQLSTIHIPIARAGVVGLEMLLDLIAFKDKEPVALTLPSELVVRRSTAPR